MLTCLTRSSCADAESFFASTLCRFTKAELAVGEMADQVVGDRQQVGLL